ncbi:MAG: SurA N-terminal domain-containing protein [Asticcacaulis sp.]
MLTVFRNFTKSWVFKIIMGLLIASFAVFGLSDVFNKMGADNVVTAGDRKITAADFKSRYDTFKKNYPEQNQGQTFTNEEFVAAGQHVRMLNELADQTAFSAWLDSLGVRPSAKMIVADIAKIPAFFNSVTGRFDKDTYTQLLRQNNLTETSFEESISDEIAAQQFLSSIAAGFKAPRIYAAAEAATAMQNRDASFFVISDRNITMPSPPTDADLKTFYQSRLTQLQMPEIRTASIVQFSPQAYMQDIKVDEDALQKMYKDRLAMLATPETRSFTVITAQNAKDATAISEALKGGQTPQDAAKAHNGQVITYDSKPQSEVTDAKIASAAFAMKSGDTSGAVQGSLGYAVIKMGDIKIGSTPSFDSVRAQLADEYVKEQAANRVNKDSNAFSDAMRAGDDFAATAAKLGLKVHQLDPMTAQGKTSNPQADYSKFATLVKDIFDLSSVGSASDVEEMGEGQYFAVRLDAIKPAGAPPLDEIKGELAQYWMADKVSTAITAKAEEVMARLNKGESFSAVAASLGAKIETRKGMNRATVQQANLPEALVGRIFVAKAGDHFSVPLNQFNVAIGQLDAVQQADIKAANSMASVVRTQISQEIAKDLALTARSQARTQIKTTINPRVAEVTLGITPADPKDAKKPETTKTTEKTPS